MWTAADMRDLRSSIYFHKHLGQVPGVNGLWMAPTSVITSGIATTFEINTKSGMVCLASNRSCEIIHREQNAESKVLFTFQERKGA